MKKYVQCSVLGNLLGVEGKQAAENECLLICRIDRGELQELLLGIGVQPAGINRHIAQHFFHI